MERFTRFGLYCLFVAATIIAPLSVIGQTTVQYRSPENYSCALQMRTSGYDTTFVQPTVFHLGNCAFPLPLGVSDLTTGFEFKYNLLSSDASGSIQVLGFGGGNYSRKAVHVVIEFMQKRSFNCEKDTVTFGAGLIALLSIERQSGKIDVTNLPQVAASVTLGKLKASYSLRTIGITGPVALQVLPTNFEFDTDSYKEFYKVMDLVKNLYESDPAKLNITPQLLPRTIVIADPKCKKAKKS
ncbi:MAG: hypothetical protein U0176_12805 [Bacteroidia bacterium]